MHTRRLGIPELARVVEVDVSEADSRLLSLAGSRIVSDDREWQRPARSSAGWAPYVAEWADVLATGGLGFGAFQAQRLVGVAILRLDLAPGMAQLAALFVDRAHRRQGVASALTDAVERAARRDGAAALYVSASETPSAVGFYLSRDFAPTPAPDPVLLAREPLDIHMVKRL